MALSILVVVILSVTTLSIQNIRANRLNLNALMAQYYAVEGLEAVRGMRDSNVLQNYYWLGSGTELWGDSFANLSEAGANYKISLNDLVDATHGPWSLKEVDLDKGDDVKIKDTIFERYIYIKPVFDGDDVNKIYVEANISWQERGKNKDLKLFTTLTNWRN